MYEFYQAYKKGCFSGVRLQVFGSDPGITSESPGSEEFIAFVDGARIWTANCKGTWLRKYIPRP